MQIMPFEDAKTYRFNPFDLTKVWPHADYPLHEVGRLTLNRNVTDYHTEIEQAAFEPNNLVRRHRAVAGQDAAGPRVQLLRRPPRPARRELPADPGQPAASRRSTATPRTARCGSTTSRDPVYAPNSYGGPKADPALTDDGGLWYSDGEMVRAAYTLRADDDDWGQAGTLVREVLDDAARAAAGRQHRRAPAQRGQRDRSWTAPSSTGATSTRTSATGSRPASAAKQDETDPKAAEQGNPARSSMQDKA